MIASKAVEGVNGKKEGLGMRKMRLRDGEVVCERKLRGNQKKNRKRISTKPPKDINKKRKIRLDWKNTLIQKLAFILQ